VLVAAPASGQGKTTVAAALARLHARQGRRVRAFKCGPDFLDPHWLALATGAPVHSLDLWMTGEADCRARLRAAAASADLLIVEGVMGLFDGTPSAADLAERFGLPVLAVIDAARHGRHLRRAGLSACRTSAPACRGPACWPTAWPASAMRAC
jgi:cobyrinic acid a,c-diamide synthase